MQQRALKLRWVVLDEPRGFRQGGEQFGVTPDMHIAYTEFGRIHFAEYPHEMGDGAAGASAAGVDT
jgi:hypothetical protein